MIGAIGGNRVQGIDNNTFSMVNAQGKITLDIQTFNFILKPLGANLKFNSQKDLSS